MLSYIAIYGTEQGVGHTNIEAVVTDDGDKITVIGTTGLAGDLRENVEDFPGTTSDPDTRLTAFSHGLSYHRVQGPYHAHPSLKPKDVALGYGL